MCVVYPYTSRFAFIKEYVLSCLVSSCFSSIKTVEVCIMSWKRELYHILSCHHFLLSPVSFTVFIIIIIIKAPSIFSDSFATGYTIIFIYVRMALHLGSELRRVALLSIVIPVYSFHTLSSSNHRFAIWGKREDCLSTFLFYFFNSTINIYICIIQYIHT